MTSPQPTSDLQAVADAIRAHDGYVVTTHENPDGDALGSLLGMKLALDALGKESAMYLAGEQPLPIEYRFMTLDGLVRGSAADLAGRPVIAVDAANEKRLGDPALLESAPFAIDIDHHHDNSRFGQANLVVAEASSTAEVLRDVFAALDVALTPAIAEALYIGLVTDTGRFQYKNTTPKALRLGGELVEHGADVHRIFQNIYESIEFPKLKLLARALERAQLLENGELIVSYITRADFDETGAQAGASEGIIDSLRAVEGTIMAALIQEPADRPGMRVSLRAAHGDVDVSAIARKSSGGGHRQAAGFSNAGTVPEIIEFVRSEYVAARNGDPAVVGD
jgi:phosphoesterase RecJ-like protein